MDKIFRQYENPKDGTDKLENYLVWNWGKLRNDTIKRLPYTAIDIAIFYIRLYIDMLAKDKLRRATHWPTISQELLDDCCLPKDYFKKIAELSNKALDDQYINGPKTPQSPKDRICWTYHGFNNMYSIELNGEIVHWAKNEFDRDLFIATLKDKLERNQNE